jgi:DNA mismatch repair ATPase MutS
MTEGFLRSQLRKKAKTVIDGVSCNAEGLLLLSNILELLEREPFVSPQLQKLCTPLKEHPKPSSELIRRLAGIVYWIDARHSLLAGLAEVPLLYTLQIGFAAEAWRRRWGRRMRTWVNAAAEMEALLSLATYSFEHPADLFPEFIEDSAVLFNGENLGHPLIPDAQCVRNSVRLDKDTRVMLVSGSNMSGKSTLLRTIGINAVLAMSGAPIRGKSLRLSPLITGTSIRRADSLQEGRSGFYTEILQIRRVFTLTEEPTPVLFLFDELLEGTNSKDRRIGSEGLLKALLNSRAIGVVTTHDLALTEITDSADGLVRNMHFEDQVKDGKMYFDYKLRDGVVSKSNALELMRLMGFEI